MFRQNSTPSDRTIFITLNGVVREIGHCHHAVRLITLWGTAKLGLIFLSHLRRVWTGYANTVRIDFMCLACFISYDVEAIALCDHSCGCAIGYKCCDDLVRSIVTLI